THPPPRRDQSRRANAVNFDDVLPHGSGRDFDLVAEKPLVRVNLDAASRGATGHSGFRRSSSGPNFMSATGRNAPGTPTGRRSDPWRRMTHTGYGPMSLQTL